MQMQDKLRSKIDLKSLTLKEVDLVNSTTLRISYFLNTVKVTNNLEYAIERNAQKDYDSIIEMLGGSPAYLVE